MIITIPKPIRQGRIYQSTMFFQSLGSNALFRGRLIKDIPIKAGMKKRKLARVNDANKTPINMYQFLLFTIPYNNSEQKRKNSASDIGVTIKSINGEDIKMPNVIMRGFKMEHKKDRLTR